MEKVKPKLSFPNIGKILWEKLENQNGVDFVFQFVDESDDVIDSIGVHSLVLTSQSKVFDAMINGKLKEKSPMILKDTAPSIFKKFIATIYGQETHVFTPEEARDLYYLGHKYDYPVAATIARNYFIENIDYTNCSLVHECSLLFDDAELLRANWDFLEKSIVKTINGLKCIDATPSTTLDDCSFEVKHPSSGVETLKSLRGVLKEVCNEQDVKKKVSFTVALIQSLTEECEKAFRSIVPNETISLVTRIQHNKSDFLKLNKFFNANVKCMVCPYATHKLVECKGNAAIYNKYKHDDLFGYSMADIIDLYNRLNAFLPDANV